VNPALIAAAILGALLATRLARAAILRRNHRDVGGFVGYAILAAGVVVLVASLIAIPGTWLRLYRGIIHLYSGD
jgi:phosphatidylserine synthase